MNKYQYRFSFHPYGAWSSSAFHVEKETAPQLASFNENHTTYGIRLAWGGSLLHRLEFPSFKAKAQGVWGISGGYTTGVVGRFQVGNVCSGGAGVHMNSFCKLGKLLGFFVKFLHIFERLSVFSSLFSFLLMGGWRDKRDRRLPPLSISPFIHQAKDAKPSGRL